MSRLILDLLWRATAETLEMVLTSGLLAVAGGLPLAVLLVLTSPAGLYPLPLLSRILGGIVDAVRAVPFIILLVLLIPFTRMVVGTALGTTAAIVPLSIAAIPYFARIAEVSLREVDAGLVDAVRAMGGTRWMVVRYVLLPESLPGLISGFTVTLVTLVGASAMRGPLVLVGWVIWPSVMATSVLTPRLCWAWWPCWLCWSCCCRGLAISFHSICGTHTLNIGCRKQKQGFYIPKVFLLFRVMFYPRLYSTLEGRVF